jgi:hypothetical protein
MEGLMNIANFNPIVSHVTAPVIGALTDRSGAITAGGTSQQVAAAKTNRAYLLFQNISDTAMWLNFGAAATADNNSIFLNSQGSMLFSGSFIPSDSVNVLCATTGKKFVCKEG